MVGGVGRWKCCCGWIEDDDDVVFNLVDFSIEVIVVCVWELRIWLVLKWVYEVYCLKMKE